MAGRSLSGLVYPDRKQTKIIIQVLGFVLLHTITQLVMHVGNCATAALQRFTNCFFFKSMAITCQAHCVISKIEATTSLTHRLLKATSLRPDISLHLIAMNGRIRTISSACRRKNSAVQASLSCSPTSSIRKHIRITRH